MAFRPAGKKTYRIKITVGDTRVVLSTGCTVEADANAVESVVAGWLGRRHKREARPAVIAALVGKTLSLEKAYEAHTGEGIDALMAQRAEEGAVDALDLVPLMREWYAEKLAGEAGVKTAHTYYRQLRTLFPEAVVPLTRFTRKEIHRRIMALKREPARSGRRAQLIDPTTAPTSAPLTPRSVHPTTRLALALVDATPGLATKRRRAPHGLAADGGVTHQVLYDVTRVLQDGTPLVIAGLRDGTLSLYAARQVVRLKRSEQDARARALAARRPRGASYAALPADALRAKPICGATRSKYRTAASLFADYLVIQEVLDANVCAGMKGYGNGIERKVYYERHDAQRLIAGLPAKYAGAAAFACGFCAEWCAAKTLTVADVDFTKGAERALVKGTKRATRWRWVPLLRENTWVLPYLKAAAAGKLPSARMFPGIDGSSMLRTQQRVARELGIVAAGEDTHGQHTFHDWRHTHSVQLYRDGYDEIIGMAHLGHKNVDQFRKRYGNFNPTKEDYARALKPERSLRRMHG